MASLRITTVYYTLLVSNKNKKEHKGKKKLYKNNKDEIKLIEIRE